MIRALLAALILAGCVETVCEQDEIDRCTAESGPCYEECIDDGGHCAEFCRARLCACLDDAGCRESCAWKQLCGDDT